ncbi:MAG TPA: phosphatase PAP2 family protein [Candidatus Thermoplasmatota archaeon]|nr:phosphatase PAP2 family protein [Candidatus Thermoplasmatota archaeon]
MATGDPLLDFALGLRSDALTPIMRALSDLNSQYAYLVAIPVLYWLLSRRVGFALLLADAAATSATVIMKDGFALARPPDAGETAWLSSAEGYGFPSGHTSAASTTWGTLAAKLRKAPVALAGAAVTVAVGLSRMYLGVHYGRDVVGGALLGLAVGLFVLLAAPSLEGRIRAARPAQRFALAAVLPALLLANTSREGVVIVCAATGAVFGHLAADELGAKWTLKTGDPRTLPVFGLARMAIGLPVLGLLALGLGSPSSSDVLALALRFTLLGAFMTLLGPRVFNAAESKLPARLRGRATT